MKRILPFILIAFGSALLLFVSGWTYVDYLVKNPKALPLSGQIAGLPLSSQLTGAQAAENFSALHGKEFPITSGAVGFYGNGQITLWVAGTPLEFMAGDLVESMRVKIALGNSPVIPTDEVALDGRTIYLLDGMGQKHFYFQSQNLVVWLAADSTLADNALAEILKAYP